MSMNSMSIEVPSVVELPSPIAAYFAADRGQGQGVADCFTADAVVQDEGHVYRGRDEIRKWRAEAAAKYTYTIAPLAVAPRGDQTVVTCLIRGNFPGNEATLLFCFRLAGDVIQTLEVLPAAS